MLIPRRSPALIVQEHVPDKEHVTMRVRGVNEVFQFPRRDVMILDVEYTSIEDLGEVISKMIYGELVKKGEKVTSNIEAMKVSV